MSTQILHNARDRNLPDGVTRKPALERYLTGLVGREILASRSPWLHEREADAHRVRLIYTLFDFAERGWSEADLPRMLDAAETIGFAGLNITFPYKQAIIPHLHALSDGARGVGAVNTVEFRDGQRIGHNTDVTGFRESVERGLPGAPMQRVVQFGAGGAGFATARALLELGVEQLTIIDLDSERREALIARLNADFGAGRALSGDDRERAIEHADGLVNATPMGMAKHPGSPVPAALLRPDLWVADIVYFPLQTQLLRDAEARGCRTLNGGGMVVNQAASAFEIFTGLNADRARMAASFIASFDADR